MGNGTVYNILVGACLSMPLCPSTYEKYCGMSILYRPWHFLVHLQSHPVFYSPRVDRDFFRRPQRNSTVNIEDRDIFQDYETEEK